MGKHLRAFIILFFVTLSSCSDNGQTTTPQPLLPAPPANVEKNFCGVPPDIMIEMLKNYRNTVWCKTSDTLSGKYDARFMEISIEQLENFLAFAKQSAQSDNVHLASVRMYYIAYPGEKKTSQYLSQHHTGNVFEDYSGCHSIALVPVVGQNISDPARRDYYQTGGVPSDTLVSAHFSTSGNLIFVPDNCRPNSTVENHNELCPPMRGCVQSTLLEAADQ